MRVRRLRRVLAVCVLLTGGIGGLVLLAAKPAQAQGCGTSSPTGTLCTLTGTTSVSAGTLNLTTPAALSWAATVKGFDQQLSDTDVAQQAYVVNDATGSGAGWHVTVSATTFTSDTPATTLPDTATFSTNGSLTSQSASSYPSATCSPGASTCAPPAHVTASTAYPVLVTTAAASPTTYTIYSADAGTGMGSVIIGGPTAANPVGWWVNLPAAVLAATYTSTVTLQVISAP